MHTTTTIISLLLLVPLLSIVVSALAPPPQAVRDGFSPNRGPDVVLVANTQPSIIDAQFIINGDAQRSSAGVSMYEMANTVTRAFGMPALNPELAAAAPVRGGASFLRRPRANLLVTVDGVGGRRATSLGLKTLASASTAQRVSHVSVPVSSVTMATSIATAHPATHHGIVDTTWTTASDGRQHTAYSGEAENYARQSNLADMFVTSFPNALVLSASASQQLAAAFAVNPFRARASNAFCVAATGPGGGDDDQQGFQDVAASSSSSMFSSSSSRNVVATAGTRALVQRLNANVKTDDGSPAWQALLREVAFMTWLPTKLASSTELRALVDDDVPDAYFLTFASLRAVAAEYGESSAHFRLACELVNAAVAQLIADFARLYPGGGGVMSESVLLGERAPALGAVAHTEAVLTAVNHALQSHGVNAVVPSIPASGAWSWSLDTATLRAVCTELEPTLLALNVHTYCPSLSWTGRLRAPHMATAALKMAPPVSFLETNAGASEADVNQYQVILWISILLTIAVLWAVYATMFMDMKRDTLIYGKFNPNWAKKQN